MVLTAILMLILFGVLLFVGPFIVDHLDNSNRPYQPR